MSRADRIGPDLAMLWVHVVDRRAFHHHKHWVQAPGFWLFVVAVFFPLAVWKVPVPETPILVFLASVLIHLCLDEIGGGIMCLWPFSNPLAVLVEVPAAKAALGPVVHAPLDIPGRGCDCRRCSGALVASCQRMT